MLGVPNESTGILELLGARTGHFQLESGHHGELWLDLDTFLVRPALLTPYIDALARRLADTVALDGVCGPLLGGALIAGAVATALRCELYVAEPAPPAGPPGGLFRARYTVPQPVRARVATTQEHKRLWPKAVATYGGYRGYQERTKREIPLVVLEPR